MIISFKFFIPVTIPPYKTIAVTPILIFLHFPKLKSKSWLVQKISRESHCHARKRRVSLVDTKYYHCISRFVRRDFCVVKTTLQVNPSSIAEVELKIS